MKPWEKKGWITTQVDVCMLGICSDKEFFLCFCFSFMVIRMENSIWQCPLLWEFNDDLTMEMRSQLQSQCSKIWTKIANLGIHITAGVNAIPLVHTLFALFCFFQNTAMLLMFKFKVSLSLNNFFNFVTWNIVLLSYF